MMMKKYIASSKKRKTYSIQEYREQKLDLINIKVATIDTIFMTKTAQQPYPLGAAHTSVAHKTVTSGSG